MLVLMSEGLVRSKSRRARAFKKPLIGLTGSLASGKSTTLKVFRKQGFRVLSADDVVAEIYSEQGLTKEEILKRFGSSQAGIKKLEKWIHPLVKAKILKFIRLNKKLPIIIEVPLLYEAKFERLFALTVFVFAPQADRLARAQRRGMSNKVFKLLDSRQMKASEKAFKSDFVLQNYDKPLLKRQAKALAKLIKSAW